MIRIWIGSSFNGVSGSVSKLSFFEVLDALFKILKASPVAWAISKLHFFFQKRQTILKLPVIVM